MEKDLNKAHQEQEEKKQQTWIDDTDKDDWIDVEYPGVYGEDNKDS